MHFQHDLKALEESSKIFSDTSGSHGYLNNLSKRLLPVLQFSTRWQQLETGRKSLWEHKESIAEYVFILVDVHSNKFPFFTKHKIIPPVVPGRNTLIDLPITPLVDTIIYFSLQQWMRMLLLS